MSHLEGASILVTSRNLVLLTGGVQIHHFLTELIVPVEPEPDEHIKRPRLGSGPEANTITPWPKEVRKEQTLACNSSARTSQERHRRKRHPRWCTHSALTYKNAQRRMLDNVDSRERKTDRK